VLSQMELKMQLVRDWNEKHMNVTDLAQKFKISRPTVRGEGVISYFSSFAVTASSASFLTATG